MATGILGWSLPGSVEYRAGSLLPITFWITNPTDSVRSYQIFMALFDESGSVIPGTTGAVSIDGVDTFEVGAGETVTLTGSFRMDYSNVSLHASLYDVESGEMAIGLVAFLEQPPGIEEQISPVTAFASGVLVLGAVGMLVSRISRGMRR